MNSSIHEAIFLLCKSDTFKYAHINKKVDGMWENYIVQKVEMKNGYFPLIWSDGIFLPCNHIKICGWNFLGFIIRGIGFFPKITG